jgi:hypothetical protein
VRGEAFTPQKVRVRCAAVEKARVRDAGIDRTSYPLPLQYTP